MITQKRAIDEIDIHAYEFLHDLAEKHEFSNLGIFCEIKSRAIGIDTYHEHITDDKIIEFIVDDELVGFVYLRRDCMNWTEATFIEIPEAIERARNSLKSKGILKD